MSVREARHGNHRSALHLIEGMATERAAWNVIHQEIARTPHVHEGAGIYLHGGTTHLVGHYTAAEAVLLAAGALLVATVRFDRSAPDAGRRTGEFRPATPYAFAGRHPVPSSN